MKSNRLLIREWNQVKYIQFPHIEKTELVCHGFSTRHGGVSSGEYASMNLGFKRGDDVDRVRENYKRFGEAIGVGDNSFVLSDQIHKTEVRLVGIDDAGKGYCKESDIIGVDGLITDTRGITLTTFYADCVPLFFLDPVNGAIGLSHAGWRGTVGGIAVKTVEAMENAFGTNAEDLLVGIGPSIGPCCYEVSEDVIIEFKNNTNHVIIGRIAQKSDSSHYMLNLWEANRQLLLSAGIKAANIEVTDLCTKCHSEEFYSHRVMGTTRGSLAAMMALK